ncbi:fumarate hydratase C-terminal domain-containing protein [Sellimonas catena]|uniref:Fe-S hydro-lyase tartrate dehydratase beta-type catalytic domain-containing protein n=1 Tax=Sellimonas catena TaxID=2994035 RepID=A0A9W6CI67_9FIRM|nr:fumarate hydratase C-terminal domain-containing protein [Sellimonas catena]GLG91664.1 hypothetical protein Selli2_30910 [Sellimonas catena]
MKELHTPISLEQIQELEPGDMIYISGEILTGRDAVLPKLVEEFRTNSDLSKKININGSVIFHTAVSNAGVGPTSSNKLEIEESMVPLTTYGVKIHLGKGKIGEKTILGLKETGGVFAIIPPVTALLESKIIKREVIAFEEEGMEALHAIEVNKFPVIIAAARGKSIYDETNE